MIVLSLELEHLHQTRGYQGAGSWQSYRHEVESGERLAWEDFCKHHAGVTESTYRNYLKAGRVVLGLLRADPRPEAAELIRALEQVPSDLNDGQRQGMIDDMVRLVITTDEAWKSIRKAATRTVRPPESIPSKSIPSKSIPPKWDFESRDGIEKIALRVGLDAAAAHRVANSMIVRKIFGITQNSTAPARKPEPPKP